MTDGWVTEMAEMARAGGDNPPTPYDAARYARLSVLAGEVRAAVQHGIDALAPRALLPLDRTALQARTPIVAGEAAVFDARDRLLLIQRTDSRLWAMPGGAADVGDRPAAVAERETREETGLRVHATRLIGIYARPRHDALAAQLYVLVFLCRYQEGEPVITHESLDVGYFPARALPPLHRGQDQRVRDAYAAHAAGDTWAAVYS